MKIQLTKFTLVTVLVITVALCLLLPATVMAHAPLTPGDNESLATATEIPDPLKSWAIYGELHEHEGEEPHAQYFKFDIAQGQKIHVMLYKSRRSEEAAFLPSFVLMGPALIEQGTVPNFVEQPADAESLVIEGQQPAAATYEPFSPSSFYSLADLSIDAPASGTYYIAIYASEGGHYGLAVGDRESYGIDEWILIPINLISVYQWEGQSLALILAPFVVVLAVGAGLIIMRMKKKGTLGTLMTWFGVLAGLLFIGTGVANLFRMILSLIGTSAGAEVGITLVFALIPFILGAATLRLVLRKEERVSVKKRVYFVILGVVALFMWTGLLIGPVLAIIAGLMPSSAQRDALPSAVASGKTGKTKK